VGGIQGEDRGAVVAKKDAHRSGIVLEGGSSGPHKTLREKG